jgi:pimeloyl-ACP methyl ester carboxylesterase
MIAGNETAQRLGARVIAVDRPGMGQSGFKPGRRFSDWPDDVAALADSLGINRFSVLGFSSGGAYALACALAIPDRLERVGLLSADGPYDGPELTNGMDSTALRLLRLSRTAPRIYQWLLLATALLARRFPRFYIRGFQSLLPEADRQVFVQRPIREACAAELRREEYLQYLFARQWRSLKAYCEARGVRVIGDLSIYVNFDSADVWAHPTLFKLHADKTPECVSGVPPDYFSPTGQLWGNPVYRWERLQETGFGWWIDRVGHQAELFDALRIDHFRGLVAYWEVPATEATALRGRWVPAPTDAFFAALHTRFPGLRVLAEDLGLITPDVRTVLERLGFPGMRVLRMPGETRVSGHVADQAALHGVIDRLESLGLRLLEVSQRDEGDDGDA